LKQDHLKVVNDKNLLWRPSQTAGFCM